MAGTAQLHGNSRFCEEHAANAWLLAKSGWSNSDIAADLGISRRTFDRWLCRHPEFRARIDEARRGVKKLVHHAAFERAVGFTAKTERVIETANGPVVVKVAEYHPPSTAAQKWWLNHQRRCAEHQTKLAAFRAQLGAIAANHEETAQ
jgi:hypothetical protein